MATLLSLCRLSLSDDSSTSLSLSSSDAGQHCKSPASMDSYGHVDPVVLAVESNEVLDNETQHSPSDERGRDRRKRPHNDAAAVTDDAKKARVDNSREQDSSDELVMEMLLEPTTSDSPVRVRVRVNANSGESSVNQEQEATVDTDSESDSDTVASVSRWALGKVMDSVHDSSDSNAPDETKHVLSSSNSDSDSLHSVTKADNEQSGMHDRATDSSDLFGSGEVLQERIRSWVSLSNLSLARQMAPTSANCSRRAAKETAVDLIVAAKRRWQARHALLASRHVGNVRLRGQSVLLAVESNSAVNGHQLATQNSQYETANVHAQTASNSDVLLDFNEHDAQRNQVLTSQTPGVARVRSRLTELKLLRMRLLNEPDQD